MYSNCYYSVEAFAHKENLPMSKPYILHYTYTLYFTLCFIVYSYSIAIAIANKDYTLVINFVVRIFGTGNEIGRAGYGFEKSSSGWGLGLG